MSGLNETEEQEEEKDLEGGFNAVLLLTIFSFNFQ
jgi:hypothetical protein